MSHMATRKHHTICWESAPRSVDTPRSTPAPIRRSKRKCSKDRFGYRRCKHRETCRCSTVIGRACTECWACLGRCQLGTRHNTSVIADRRRASRYSDCIGCSSSQRRCIAGSFHHRGCTYIQRPGNSLDHNLSRICTHSPSNRGSHRVQMQIYNLCT